VHPMKCGPALSAEQMVSTAEQQLLNRRLIDNGDVLGVVAGTRAASGSTNFMRLHTVNTKETANITGQGNISSGANDANQTVRCRVSIGAPGAQQ
jgi:hypothetical protein